LISFALTVKECNYIKPTLAEDKLLNVKGGRHPLQELCVNPFIPNDVVFNGTNGQMKILTGPSASGKSVYLKQVLWKHRCIAVDTLTSAPEVTSSVFVAILNELCAWHPNAPTTRVLY
jgi:hypothetical protein